MQATSTLLRSSSTKQPKAGPATTAARQLVLFSLPEPIACCWDLICPEEAWEQPLRPARAVSGLQDAHLLEKPPLATGVHEVVGRHGAAHGHRRHADAGEHSGAAEH